MAHVYYERTINGNKKYEANMEAGNCRGFIDYLKKSADEGARARKIQVGYDMDRSMDTDAQSGIYFGVTISEKEEIDKCIASLKKLQDSDNGALKEIIDEFPAGGNSIELNHCKARLDSRYVTECSSIYDNIRGVQKSYNTESQIQVLDLIIFGQFVGRKGLLEASFAGGS